MIKNAELDVYRNKTLNSSFKGVVFSYLTQVLYLNYINSKNFTYLVAQEQFVTNQLVFYFQRNHFLAETISRKLEAFRESGLIEKLTSKYVDMRFLKSKLTQQPSALTFKNLSAVFGIFLCGLALSIFVVVSECICYKLAKHKKSKEIIKFQV